jgi:protein-tyrosine-phosphatase
MAEALMRDALARRGCDEVEVTSSGTWAEAGYGAAGSAVDALRGHGIDLSSHRTRGLDPSEVEDADVVVAMTSVHVREILDVAPDAADKLVMLKEIPEIRMSNGTPIPDSAKDRLQRLLSGTRPEARRSLDVDDPIGLPAGAYDRCVGDLRSGVDALVSVICGDH